MAAALTSLADAGVEVNGIVHAADVLEDATLSLQDVAKIIRVLKPKVDGAWNLHEISVRLGLKLGMFVPFPSISSVTVNIGHSNYAVANAYLVGLAALRRSMGLPAFAINWGAWSEVGMAANLSTASG